MRQHASAAAIDSVVADTGARTFAVARQPILDAQLRVVGYELLVRRPGARPAQVVDSQAATSNVIVDSFMEIGLDELVGEHLAYLNVSREFLMSVRPLPLPPDRVVIELLENQVIDEELLTVLRELVADGFTIALDDFRYTPEAEPLLDLARIVKLDVLALDEDELLDQVAMLRRRRPRLSLLAEKVETRADFDRCRILGFDAFQGYFFARPSLTHGRGVPTQCLGALGAVASLNTVEDFDDLERIITRDVGLSLRLLRYANSAYVFLPRRVGSVREALVMLGARQVRRWATVVVLAGSPDAPHVLLVTGLIRAKMCQLLSGAGDEQSADRFFTVGLFSVVDALVDAPMGEVLATLPFSEDIVTALQQHHGPSGELLGSVLAYEHGDFEAVAEPAPSPGRPTFASAYRDAVTWADGTAMMLA